MNHCQIFGSDSQQLVNSDTGEIGAAELLLLDRDQRQNPTATACSAPTTSSQEDHPMSHIPQSLHDLYPADAALLRRLKAQDGHFQHLAARLDALDSAIAAIDSGADPASDERAEVTSRERLATLDQLAGLIGSARVA
jgi:uncharacterized protein